MNQINELEEEAKPDEILACASYYGAIGHFEVANHLETEIKQTFEKEGDPQDYYYNDIGHRNYCVYLRCNVQHYMTNAYEQLLRSIIYSEGEGITGERRKEIRIYGHGLQSKVRLISHPLTQKLDHEIKKNMRVVRDKIIPSSEQARQIQKANFRRLGSLMKMATFLDTENKRIGEVRYRYERLAEGNEIEVMGTGDTQMSLITLLAIFGTQSDRLIEKYRTFHAIHNFFYHVSKQLAFFHPPI